jgi:hypothetical protein
MPQLDRAGEHNWRDGRRADLVSARDPFGFLS